MKDRDAGLMIDEAMPFQFAEWRLQRIAWAVLIVLLLAAVLGLTGSGPLSQTQAAFEQGQVNYQRFAHVNAPLRMDIELRAPSGGLPTLRLNRDLLDRAEITGIAPQPAAARADRFGIVYAFEPGADERVRVTLNLKLHSAGAINPRIELNGVPAALKLWAYP